MVEPWGPPNLMHTHTHTHMGGCQVLLCTRPAHCLFACPTCQPSHVGQARLDVSVRGSIHTITT